MARGKLQHVTAKYRAQLLAHQQQAEQQLEAWYKHVLAQIQPRLDALYQQMGDMQQANEDIPVSWLYEKNRLASIKQLITDQINLFGLNAGQLVTGLQRIGGMLGQQLANAQLEATVPDGISYQFGVPSLKAINEMVGTLQDGSPLVDLFNTFGEQAAKDVQSALVTGLTLGDNPRKVARDVEQALNVPRARALTLARTEMMRPYRSAALETYNANSDVVEQWTWSADLSSRSCFPAGTMVETEHGSMPIEHIWIGEKVLTHTGQYKPVVVVSKMPYSGRMLTIHTKHGKVTATSEHPFLVERQGKLDWIEASNLRLGDHVFSQFQRTPEISNHNISDVSIERSVRQSHDLIPSRLKPERFTGVSFFDTNMRMPVNTIDLEAGVQRWQEEINRITPTRDSVFLPIFNSQSLEADTRSALGFGFTCKAPITTHRAERFNVGTDFTRSNAILLPALFALSDENWTSAFFRTVMVIRAVLIENFATTFTGNVNHLRHFTCSRAIDLPFMAWIDRERFLANRADFRWSFMGFPANNVAIISRSVVQCSECYTTSFADQTQRWFSFFSSSSMRVCSLMKRITRSRAKSTIAFSNPSVGNCEWVVALNTNLFHDDIITQIDTQIQNKHVYNLEVLEDHSYVANGFVVHNCAMCIAMNGTMHDLSEDFESHANCRCAPIPATKSWADILGPGVDLSGIEDTSVQLQDGSEWFDQQSADVQRSILGSNAAYSAYKDGAITLKDLVGKSHSKDWGTSRYQRSLKEALGAKRAQKYYKKAS